MAAKSSPADDGPKQFVVLDSRADEPAVDSCSDDSDPILHAEVQLNGQSEWRQAWMLISADVLRCFSEPSTSAASCFLSEQLNGCEARKPKSARQGRPYAFRLDFGNGKAKKLIVDPKTMGQRSILLERLRSGFRAAAVGRRNLIKPGDLVDAVAPPLRGNRTESSRGFFGTLGDAMGSSIGSILGMSYTAPLEDKALISLLAACAEHVYSLDDTKHDLLTAGQGSQIVKSNAEPFGSPGLQWALYSISRPVDCSSQHGSQRKETILAFRGTTELGGNDWVASETKAAVEGPLLKLAADLAVSVARELKPDWICGHCLGGLLAEYVCRYAK
eukprot:SAG31_NODE_4418_length_3251_cov_5.297313_3_plen_331_part_00